MHDFTIACPETHQEYKESVPVPHATITQPWLLQLSGCATEEANPAKLKTSDVGIKPIFGAGREPKPCTKLRVDDATASASLHASAGDRCRP